MPAPGYQELTDPENERILGTLTHRAWVGLSVEDIASDWYTLDPDLKYLLKAENPLSKLVETARFSSAAINGEGRKDLTQALVGSPQQSSSLTVGVLNGAQPQKVIDAKRSGFDGR